jgi:large subunit ribosomal protein L21
MKYAVIRTGGKQYRVSEGDVLESKSSTARSAQRLSWNDVLFVGGDGEAKIGAPLVTNAKVDRRDRRSAAREKNHRFQKEKTQKLQPAARPQAVSNRTEDHRHRSVN